MQGQMTVQDIAEALEEFAPSGFQESYDNSGLVVGRSDMPVREALLCVDATEQVMEEAIETGAELIISHHPVIFKGLRRLNSASHTERVVEMAIRHGKALYACHTNLDSTPEGMSFRLGNILGLKNMQILSKERDQAPNGFGIVGSTEKPEDTVAFLRRMQQTLGLQAIRHSEIVHRQVRRVAVCTGSGASLLDSAKASGAELYVAADFKYNDFMDADGRIIIADIGHFESEYCAIELMYDIIRKKFPNFALRKSLRGRNPINYLV